MQLARAFATIYNIADMAENVSKKTPLSWHVLYAPKCSLLQCCEVTCAKFCSHSAGRWLFYLSIQHPSKPLGPTFTRHKVRTAKTTHEHMRGARLYRVPSNSTAERWVGKSSILDSLEDDGCPGVIQDRDWPVDSKKLIFCNFTRAQCRCKMNTRNDWSRSEGNN